MTEPSRYQQYRDRRRGGPARAPAPCGTYPAARRHQRRGEPLCAACAEAKRVYERAAQRTRRKPSAE